MLQGLGKIYLTCFHTWIIASGFVPGLIVYLFTPKTYERPKWLVGFGDFLTDCYICGFAINIISLFTLLAFGSYRLFLTWSL